MPLETLSERLQMSLRRLTGRGKLTEKDIDEAMREIRVALLEADVNYRIVKNFIAEVRAQSIGERVMKSLTPGDQVVKIVYEQLVKLMGQEAAPVNLKTSGTSVIMLCGLQGSGKTTQAAKLATYLRKNNGVRPLLVACDVYRPAAINQLVQLGRSLDVEVFELGDKVNPVEIAKKSIDYAKKNNYNCVIIDTAGRLQIDEVLMNELAEIKKAVNPDEVMLVIDAMTGQDAINVTTAFHQLLAVTGCILTKLDSDTRGGAALSIRYMTDIPIKFIGVGEKADQLEVFHPERMANRILGMGDVLTLIEKATQNIDEDEAMKLNERLSKGIFTYNDFLDQIKNIKKMGSLKGLLGMLPGVGSQVKNLDIDDSYFNSVEAMIGSMTKEERKKPDLLSQSYSRKMRIAKGSGHSYAEVNTLTKKFEEMKKQMVRLASMDEDQMQSQMRSGQAFQTKQKKGKGKHKGGFRI